MGVVSKFKSSKVEAASELTMPERLSELACDSDPAVQRAVAKNPLTAPTTLEVLSHSKVKSTREPMASHARMLELGTTHGKKLKVWFDQGFGFWVVPRTAGKSGNGQHTWFQFSEPVSLRGKDIGEGRIFGEGPTFATQIFFEKS